MLKNYFVRKSLHLRIIIKTFLFLHYQIFLKQEIFSMSNNFFFIKILPPQFFHSKPHISKKIILISNKKHNSSEVKKSYCKKNFYLKFLLLSKFKNIFFVTKKIIIIKIAKEITME